MILEGYFFLFLTETICCDPSSEPSHQGCSDEESQHMFLCITKIVPNYHQILLLTSSSAAFLQNDHKM